MKIGDVVKYKKIEDPDEPIEVLDIVGSRNCRQHNVEVDHSEFILRDLNAREIEGVCQRQLLMVQDNNNVGELQSFELKSSSYDRSVSLYINLDDGRTSVDITINSSIVPYYKMKEALDRLSWAIDVNVLKAED